MERHDLARAIFDAAHLTGEFVLRSGATSTEYFDKYLFEADPVLLREIAEHLAPSIPEGTEALAGLELGGVPIAVALSQVTGLPTLFVRKEAKSYGTAKLAEGGTVGERRITVVEDVVTSGGQVILSCGDLRERGADILGVLCVIDRQAGGPEKLAEHDLALSPLFTMDELKASQQG
ncbi:orotate phosphoribosyltransferase [Euzebya pacifica]|uniref:orotate phosphoribosyltransferase n=1 Tax=Euzebya pacifica TaxID=1608957 RepID=UPI0030F4EAC7